MSSPVKMSNRAKFERRQAKAKHVRVNIGSVADTKRPHRRVTLVDHVAWLDRKRQERKQHE